MIDARAGQHSGVVTNALLKVTPLRPIRRRVAGMCFSVPIRWSSVTNISTLGLRDRLSIDGSSGASDVGAVRNSIVASTDRAVQLHRTRAPGDQFARFRLSNRFAESMTPSLITATRR